MDKEQAIDALDTAIEHYDGIAEECRKKADIERNDYMDMRDDAYEARQLAQWLNELKYLREKIEQLTIKPEPQWIPVSERLPEESEYCIITANDGVGRRTTFAKFQKKAKSWDLTGARSYWRVIAWMPLPKPFEGGAE